MSADILPGRLLRTQIGFGAGGITVGALTVALNSFLLLFYSQVLGLAPSLAGLALASALVVDAVADPLVGMWSDRSASRHGRRHPFIYASIAPIAVFYTLLWFPPFARDQQFALFAYLFVVTVLLRFSMTLFDVPANALIPELSSDYDLRTSFSSCKTSLSWMSANAVGIAMYAFFLNDAGGASGSGVLRKAGYESAVLYVVPVIVASAALLALLIRAPAASPRPPSAVPVTKVWRSLRQIYGNRSVLVLLGSAMLFAAGSGTALALWIYFYAYFWGLGSQAINLVQVMYLLAAFVSLMLLPRIARQREKRTVALWLSGAFWLVDSLPVALRLLDLVPGTQTPLLVAGLCVHALVNGVLYNMVVSMVLSMLSDVVEDNLLKTGRREEAAVLAGQTFVSKTSTAFGTFFGGALLSWIAFPPAALPGAVAPSVLFALGATYIPLMLMLGLCSTLLLARYDITRAAREKMMTRLA